MKAFIHSMAQVIKLIINRIADKNNELSLRKRLFYLLALILLIFGLLLGVMTGIWLISYIIIFSMQYI